MTEAQFKKLVMGIATETATIDGFLYIPIGKLEDQLDKVDFSTKNFLYSVYKDGYANLCVAASIELEISYTITAKKVLKSRTFVGACNFSLSSLEPNTHFLATAKSECIKNAASDIGKFFGRGINDFLVPVSGKAKNEKQIVKANPDSAILQKFKEAADSGDIATQTMLSNIYNIILPEEKEVQYVEEK